MKRLISIAVLICFTVLAYAQAPNGIPYQAAARNSSGAILASTNISVRFTIRDSIATGAIKYRETHSVTTTAQGMFSVNVGQGTPVTGTFAGINWGTNSKFMQVELDPAGGSSYIDMGTQQMMSVPYALNSGSLKLQVSTTGDTLYSGGGNYVIIPGISAANCTVSAGSITGTATVCVGSTTSLSSSVSGGAWSSSNTPVAPITAGVVSGVSAGTATISYTVTNSCGSATTTTIVTVNPLPSAGTITGTATVTADSTTTLSNATTGGAWSSSAISTATVGSTGVVTGVAAGTATISYTVTNSCGSAVATRVVTVSAASATVGTTFGGGVIAYILQPGDPGYIAGETHGIVAAPSDQSTGIQWGCFGTTVGGTSTALGTGAANTAIVSAACGAGTAARLCADLVLGGYSDWYLPSFDELQKLYNNKISIGGFATGFYWSSSEVAALPAWPIYFLNGGTASHFYKDGSYAVRAVRSFSYPEAISGTATICVGSTTTLSSATTGGTWSSSNTGVATVNSIGVVSGVASGTVIISYTATGSLGTGTITRVVTVNPLPSAGTITGTATVTAGSTTTLSNATTGGAWSSSATGIATVGSTGVVTGVAAGTATISYTVTNSCGSAVATRVVTVSAASATVGTTFGGGVIAYILQPGDPGYIAGETHGIIAAPSDQGTAQWGCWGTTVGGTSTALGTGAANTAIVSAACGTGTAARLCADLVLNGYSDWYLPSRDELNKLYINRSSIGGFTTGHYWSSSENDGGNAWYVNFYNGNTYANGKGTTYYVRAVRAF